MCNAGRTVDMLLRIKQIDDEKPFRIEKFECQAKDTDYLTGVWVRMRTKFNSYYETKEWIEKTDAYVEINNGLYLYRNVWFDWPVWEDGVTIDIKYLWESTKISLIIGIHITISEDRFRDCFPYIKYKDDTKK